MALPCCVFQFADFHMLPSFREQVEHLIRSVVDHVRLVELSDPDLFRGSGRRDRSHRSTRKGSLGRRGAQLRRRAFGDRRSRLRSDRRAPALGAIYPGKGAGGALAACRDWCFRCGLAAGDFGELRRPSRLDRLQFAVERSERGRFGSFRTARLHFTASNASD